MARLDMLPECLHRTSPDFQPSHQKILAPRQVTSRPRRKIPHRPMRVVVVRGSILYGPKTLLSTQEPSFFMPRTGKRVEPHGVTVPVPTRKREIYTPRRLFGSLLPESGLFSGVLGLPPALSGVWWSSGSHPGALPRGPQPLYRRSPETQNAVPLPAKKGCRSSALTPNRAETFRACHRRLSGPQEPG
jgi:hypothetical protein